MSEESWDTQGTRVMAGLEPLRFMIGEWRGVGVCHGVEVEGRLTVRARIDGSWLELSETLINEDAEEVHADVSLYRFDVQSEGIEVLQLFERAHLTIRVVELLDDGFRWITGPGSPQLRFWTSQAEVRYVVTLPGEVDPAVEMSYRRA